MIVAISGTPGTGKTFLAKKLAKKLKYKHIELGKIVKKNKLYSGYDKKLKTYIVNMKKLKAFGKKIKDNTIVDGHLSHIISSDIIIVLRCRPSVLEKRLKRRRYSKEKICQNVESELIGVISYEARKRGRVWEVDCSSNKNRCLKEILAIIDGKGKRRMFDWCR